jgi:hypothetical protein
VRFSTYTLFLETRADATRKENPGGLKEAFRRFSYDIGKENAAVWVDDGGLSTPSASKGREYLSKYCEVYEKGLPLDRQLKRRDGPFVVVTELHPLEWGKRPEPGRYKGSLPVAISFRNNSSEEGIAEVLDCLIACVRASDPRGDMQNRLKQCNCGLVIVQGKVVIAGAD